MEKLKVTDGGVIKKIEYTEKYANGIYLVMDNKPVKRNCEILNIDLGENINELELKQKVTKLEKTGILTTRLMGRHFQYIFKDYADKTYVEDLIHKSAPESKEAMRTAYNLTKMDTLGDIKLMGGGLDNKN